MCLIIKKVKSEDLYSLRNKVLRNNKGIQYCKFEGDENESTVHFAAFKENLIIGGVSLIKNNTNKVKSLSIIQLRGMAVYKIYQKNKIGSLLLKKVESFCININIDFIWMNARLEAIEFYLKQGYVKTKKSFNIEGVGKHYFLYKKLK
jgi:GNAT superfamily N-acetyltransferase